jgi:tetratricopeptide (TPR) repeat protein
LALPGKQQGRAAAISEELRESLLLRKQMGERELFIPLAEIESRSGRPEEALRILEQGLAGHEERVGAWVQLARVKSRLGRLEEALQHYRHVLDQLDPRNLPALRALAGDALAKGAAEHAQAYLERWREINPMDPELEDLSEEVAFMVDPGTETASGADAVPARDLLEMSLDELKPGYIPAPSVADDAAWTDVPRGRAARAGGGKR